MATANAKPFWQSITFWGLALAVGAPLAQRLANVEIAADAVQIEQIVGGILAMYGRARADGKLSL